MWYTNEYFVPHEAFSPLFSPEDMEIALQAEMAEEFPGMLILTPRKSLYSFGAIHY